MLFPNTRRDVVKISDFAFSYCLDSRADVGALKQCLSANICPPEVFSVNRNFLSAEMFKKPL